MVELSGEELGVRSGVTAQQLRRLVELGIIIPMPRGRFRPPDIQRLRVVDTLAKAGAYDLDWASVVFPEPATRLTTILEETAAATGLPQDLAARWSCGAQRPDHPLHRRPC
jgi:hypothetical protein